MRARVVWGLVGLAMACQDYPFEPRLPQRVQGKRISEVIATVVPADILLVVDNSGTMQAEIDELRANIGLFIEELSKSDNDFQVGLVTTDVECNVPNKDCSASGHTSHSCCTLNPTTCQDQDTDGDTLIDTSDCDGGRLRASSSGRRIFTRPQPDERQQWVQEFDEILGGLGTLGSSYESGLEAALRAVRCAADKGCDPRDQALRDLNRGFIREDADLVLIFVTDEDDCSIADRTVYERPPNPADPLDQQARFCWPDECYAYWGHGIDSDLDGLSDWEDPDAGGLLKCGNPRTVNRQVNAPEPTGVSSYLDAFAQVKGSITRVRAAGILSAVASSQELLNYQAFGCVTSVLGPSRDCGCLAGPFPVDSTIWCELTGLLKQRSEPWPVPGENGCNAMPSGRYLSFLEQLATRRQEANARTDTLADSICQAEYDRTMYNIVNTIILTQCFDLGEVPASFAHIDVRLNGVRLPHIGVDCQRFGSTCTAHTTEEACTEAGCLWGSGACGANPEGCVAQDCIWNSLAHSSAGECEMSEEAGWSFRDGAREICLENELKKEIGDTFEIFLLTGGTGP